MSNKELNQLTVVIPTNNLTGHLPKIVKIIREAITKPIEIILVVDQEVTDVIIRDIDYLESLGTIQLKIIFSDSRSPGGARNMGLEKVATPWVAFWDSDDEPQIECFIDMVAEASTKPNADAALGNFLHVSDDERESRLYATRYKNFDNSVALQPGLWRFAFRVDYIGNLRFCNSKLGEDQLFLAELDLRVDAIYFSENIVYKYFSGIAGSLTSSNVAYEDLLQILAALFELHEKQKLRRYGILMCGKILLTIVKAGFKNRSFLSLKLNGSLNVKAVCFYFRSLSILFFTGAIVKRKPKSSLVTIHLAGGLGNQLFQLSAGLNASKNGSVLIEPALAFPRRNAEGLIEISDFVLPSNVLIDVDREYSSSTHKFTNLILRLSGNTTKSRMLNHLLIVDLIGNFLMRRYLHRKANLVVSEGLGYSDVLKEISNTPYLIGLFQSYKWLEDQGTRSKMQSLRLRDESIEFKLLRDLALKEKPLVVHIRLGDYKAESEFGILDGTYYRKAIEQILVGDTKIWVFTNEEALARQIFPNEFSKNVRWVTDPSLSSSQTLELMRYGSGFVIGNSTFSWWGAVLNYSGSHRIVAPFPWFKLTESPRALLPEHWITVPASYL